MPLQKIERDVVDVEEIQNLVEVELMKSQYKQVAKDYILYREKRNIARGRKTYDTYGYRKHNCKRCYT